MESITLMVIISLTHFLGALTGFGCTILAMPFVIAITGLIVAKPLLLVMGTLQPYYTLAAQWRDINWGVFKKIIVLSGCGLPIGVFIYQFLPQRALIMILGFVMIFAGVIGIAKLQGVGLEIKSKVVMILLLLVGGILQGAFVTGGPLIVICASLLLTDKNQFRATLSLIWSVLNTAILIQLIISGSFTPLINKTILLNIPTLLIAIILGQYIAGKVSKHFFDYLLNGTLCVGGIFTIANQLIIY